jgi:hypothetical protein
MRWIEPLHGCEALQVFAKNANRWRAAPLDPADVRRFRRRLDDTGIHPVVSHAVPDQSRFSPAAARCQSPR